MRNFIKRNIKIIITVIITSIICISGTTIATYMYSASEIKYNEQMSVENALNDLYGKVLIDKTNLSYINNIGVVSSDLRNATTKQFTLNKGKYILVAMARAAEYGSTYSISGSTSLNEISGDISNLMNLKYSDDPEKHLDSLRKGRGTGGIKIYIINVDETETLTFSIANNCPSDDNLYSSVGSVAIYKFQE